MPLHGPPVTGASSTTISTPSRKAVSSKTCLIYADNCAVSFMLATVRLQFQNWRHGIQVLTAGWDAAMRHGTNKDKPIYVVGSGKTAMDVVYHLSRKVPETKHRIRCISGRGMWFLVRERYVHVLV